MRTNSTLKIAKMRFKLSVFPRQIGELLQFCEALLSVRAAHKSRLATLAEEVDRFRSEPPILTPSGRACAPTSHLRDIYL
jgi:hypothetical protein